MCILSLAYSALAAIYKIPSMEFNYILLQTNVIVKQRIQHLKQILCMVFLVKVIEGREEGVQSQILKKIDQNIFSYKNYAKFIILKNSRYISLIICLIV